VGGGAAGLQSPLKPPKPKFKKKTDFIEIMISNVLRSFLLSRNQPLKSADDQYIGVSKNKLIKSKKKNKKIRHCDWVVEHVVIFVCI
jgi:hypothetical protein